MALAAVACLALAGCYTVTGGGDNTSRGEWAKPDTDSAKTARELSACQIESRRIAGADSRIDQDIAAARGEDWQRSGSYSANMAQMNESVAIRQRQYVASCMKAKGFSQPGAQ